MQLELLLSDEGNYRRYREFAADVEKLPRRVPFIPFLGLLLRDLTFLNDGNPKYTRPGVVNVSKLRRLAEPCLALQTLTHFKHTFPNADAPSAVRLRAVLQRTCARRARGFLDGTGCLTLPMLRRR